MKALLTRLALRWLRRHSPHSLSYLIRHTPPKPEPPPDAPWARTLQGIDTKGMEH